MVEHSAGKARLKYQLDARLLPHKVVLAPERDPMPSSCAAKTRWNNGAGLADVFGVFSSPQGFPRPLRWRTGSAPRHAAGGTRPWHGTRQVVVRGWCAHSWLSLLKMTLLVMGLWGELEKCSSAFVFFSHTACLPWVLATFWQFFQVYWKLKNSFYVVIGIMWIRKLESQGTSFLKALSFPFWSTLMC